MVASSIIIFKYPNNVNRHKGYEHEPYNTGVRTSYSHNFSSSTYLVCCSQLLQHCVKSGYMDCHHHIISLFSISTSRGIRFFIGQKDTKRKEMIENLKKHTNDLIPELREWAKQPLVDSKEALFLLAREHIKDTELWKILEGRKGVRALEFWYTILTDKITTQIQTSIEEQLQEKLPKFKIENLSWIVEDIEELIKKRLNQGESWAFKIVQDGTSSIFLLRSERSDGTVFRNYLRGTKDDLETFAGILKSILNNIQIEKTIKEQLDIGKRLYEKRLSFAEKMNRVIDDIITGVSDEEKILFGKCKRCEGIKKRLKMN
jgi:rubrerythrin